MECLLHGEYLQGLVRLNLLIATTDTDDYCASRMYMLQIFLLNVFSIWCFRTRADGQDDDDQSMSYEDIEREIYSDPSQLVITEKTPLPPRQDEGMLFSSVSLAPILRNQVFESV